MFELKRENVVQRRGDAPAKASSEPKFLNAAKQAAATPRREALARWSHTPQKQSGHPEHPAAPDRSGGMKNVHGFGSARLTWVGLVTYLRFASKPSSLAAVGDAS